MLAPRCGDTAETEVTPGPREGDAQLAARDAVKPKSQVPVWREGLDWSALSVDYQRILGALADRLRLGQGPSTCQEMTTAFGMDVVPARVEALRSKAKRLVARGWLAEPKPGRCTLAQALAVRRSYSRARRRVRIRWAKNRSTIHRLGRTTKPRMSSLRLTIARTSASPARQCSTRLPV